MKVLRYITIFIIVGIFLFFIHHYYQHYSKVEQETLHIATSPDIYPYSCVEENDNIGFEVEIIKHIAKVLNKKVVFKNFDRQKCLEELKEGNVDMVIGSMLKENHDQSLGEFSDSYLKIDIRFLSNGIHKTSDLFGKTISIISNSLYENIANQLSIKDPNLSIILKPLQNNVVLEEDFINKETDIILTDSLHAKSIIEKCKKLSNSGEDFVSISLDSIYNQKINLGIVVGKKSQVKVNIINSILNDMQKDGSLESIRQKWNIPSESELYEKYKTE